MRGSWVRALIAGLFLASAAALAACPRDRPPAPPAAVTDGATEPAARPAPPIVSSKLDVAGVMLGLSPELVGQRWPPEGAMNVAPLWLEEGRRGMLGATMKDGSPSPAESAWFDRGQLVGFTRTTQSSAQVFKKEVAGLEKQFGDPVKELPGWVLDSPFAKYYTKPGKDMQVALWGDKPGRALLLVIFNARDGTMLSMLADVDRYNAVSRELALRYKPAPKPKPQI